MKNSWFILLLCLLVSCNSSNKFLQTADNLATEGNYSDAADYYYTVYLTNPNNTRAKNGLIKNGQLVLNAKFSSFAKYVVENNNEKALRQFYYCKDYYKNLNEIGIELDWPTYFDGLYEETKQEFISNQYALGINQMNDKKYDKAEATFSKIMEFDSSYKDVSVLRINTVIEPLYKQGVKYLETENYKNAYKVFSQINKIDASYKNTVQNLNVALQKSSLPIAVLLINKTKYNANEDLNFYQVVIAKLSKSNNPFLKVVDRDNLEKLLKEQELGMTGIVDVNTANKAGKIIGAKYFLLLNVTQVNFNELKPTNYEELAYESFSERVVTSGGESQSVIKFKKVFYTETRKLRKVEAIVSYQLISVETGQIITSDNVIAEKSVRHSYSRFKGNIDNLYPSLPAGNYLPTVDPTWRESFYELNRELALNNVLANDVYEDISLKIINDLNLYIGQ